MLLRDCVAMHSREENCGISGPDSEVGVDKETTPITKAQNQRSKFQVAVDDKDGKNPGLHAGATLITRLRGANCCSYCIGFGQEGW